MKSWGCLNHLVYKLGIMGFLGGVSLKPPFGAIPSPIRSLELPRTSEGFVKQGEKNNQGFTSFPVGFVST